MSATPSLPNSSQTPVHSSSLSDSQPKKKQKVESSHDVKANTPQTKISSDISQILSLFECCVCLEYINPSILQCQNSHVFCQSCRQKFKIPVKCPTCRVVLLKTDIRSHLFEQIAESLRLPFPGKYKTNGCDVTSLLTEIPKHQNECEFVPYRCPDVIFEDCQWSDSRQEVAQHLIDEHKYHIINSGKFIILEIKLDDTKKSWATISSYKNQNFIFIVRFDSENKYNFKAIVLFIGEQRIADQFKYKIEIINRSNGTELQWIDKPISIRSDVKSVLLFDNMNSGLNLDQNIRRLLCDNNLYIKLTIQSKTNNEEK